jgi:hypothetical protein
MTPTVIWYKKDISAVIVNINAKYNKKDDYPDQKLKSKKVKSKRVLFNL